MIGRIIGALLGREIDRRDGGGGTTGVILGAAAAGALRRTGPLGMAIAGGYIAKKMLDRRRAARLIRATAPLTRVGQTRQ